MPKQIVNGVEYSDGFDPQTYAKIGTSNLHTTATNLSDAVNELDGDITTINSNLTNLTGKSYTTSESTERNHIKSVACSAYAYANTNNMPILIFNHNWQGNNTGYGIMSINRRFQIQVGTGLYIGVLNSDGSDITDLKKVTTTSA